MDTSFWESLRLGFEKLREACAIDPPILTAGRLTAIWTARPEPGRWRLNYHNGTDGAGVTERFKWHAQSAAARLELAQGEGAEWFWLDRIRRDAPESHIKRQFLVEGDSQELYELELLDICGLSADYCRRCEGEESRTIEPRATSLTLPELPTEFQNSFEATKAKAELEYSMRAERFPHHPHLAASPIHIIKLMQEVFFAFCDHARRACREGPWSVTRVRQAAEAMMPTVCDFYFDQEQPERTSPQAKAAFRFAFRQTTTTDPRWKAHLSELEQLANQPDTESKIIAVSGSKQLLDVPSAIAKAHSQTDQSPLNLNSQRFQEIDESPMASRRVLIDSFLSKCNELSQIRVRRKDIWRSIGHTKSRQFEYWQSGKDRLPGTTRGATQQDDQNFRRVLAMKPEDFVSQVEKNRVNMP